MFDKMNQPGGKYQTSTGKRKEKITTFAQVAALKCGTAYLLLETLDIKYLWTLHNIPDNKSTEMLHALQLQLLSEHSLTDVAIIMIYIKFNSNFYKK
jgi:hypothetical protein